MANGRVGRPDLRGSATDRHNRKMFLLNKFGRRHIDWLAYWTPTNCDRTHWIAQCHECSTLVTYDTMMVDRINLGINGGRYTRDNIQIHCPTCSHRQGNTVMRQRR